MSKKNNRQGLKPNKSAMEFLDMYYLEARCHMLETAAILDRIERAQGGGEALKDQRITDLFTICDMLQEQKENRAEKLLNMLSVS